MTEIDVVGGVYGEVCAFPVWDQVFGSAGRAAAALSDQVDKVRLHTCIQVDAEQTARLNFGSFGVQLFANPSDVFVSFDYLHCFSTPRIFPFFPRITQQPTFSVEGNVVVLFGMIECVPKVDAAICIYDPQSPISPRSFKSTGSRADRLVIIANRSEIELLSGVKGGAGAMTLLKSENAELVVAKNGLDGASVYDKTGLIGSVPAYKTENVFTIGSGDVFVAAFAAAWAIQRQSPISAADYASRAVAEYIESRTLPLASSSQVGATKRQAIALKGGKIYLAGPFRELGQRVLINEARGLLTELGMTVVSPVHDIGHGEAENVVPKDLAEIDSCDAVFAILNGSSPGTVFEVGYAIAKGKPAFCLAQNMRDQDLKLPKGAGADIHTDFVSAIHRLAWRS